MLRRLAFSFAVLFAVLVVQGAPFTPGNIVAYRVDGGGVALTNGGTAVFLDEYTPAGVLVQSIAMPNAVSPRLVANGTATTEGFLTRSQDGQYLIVPGYDAALGAATPNTSTTIPRVMGRVDSAGAIDLTSSYIDAATPGNIRSAASVDGTRFWAAGSTIGIRTVPLGGSGSPTIVSNTATNLRQVGIFGSQLYIGSGAGTIRMGTVGTGVPFTAGNTMVALPGFPTAAPTAINGYFFADLDAGVAGVDTLYVSDEGNNVISKWCLVAGSWVARGSTALTGARGLAGTVASGTVTLFATGSAAGTPIVTIADASGYNANLTGSVTTIVASAGANRAFRAVAMAPVAAVVQPNLSINDVSLNEGNAGTTTFTFAVTLSAPAGPGGVTFDIATADNTAQDDTPASEDNDYVLQSLTGQSIPMGSSGPYNFNVTVNGDVVPEANETFFVNVTNVTGATVTDGQGQGTIQNEDASCADLTINDVSQVETDAGTTTFAFTVGLSQAGCGTVTFDIATQDNTATTADNDYVANTLTGQTVAFPSTYTFNVTVNGDTTQEADQTFFVNITNVSPGNVQVTDGQGLGTIQNDDFTPIRAIQGSGTSSPLSGVVTTRGIVTGLKSNGYFLQEPDASVDADPMTSEGIFVFTSAAPPAAATVGNYVEVTGTIAEFVPSQDPLQPPLTELSSPTTVQLSTGNPLPAPIPLTATFPDPAGPFDQLERVEGMRVSVASLTVSAPTGGNVNEANATSTSNGVFMGTVTGVARPFREPGIQAPDPAPSGGGTIPPIPRWDTNPETLRVDSDGLTGAPQLDVSVSATVTGLTGPLDYGFRRYTILPDPTLPAPIAAGGKTATSATAMTGREFTVAAYNMERFFDTVNDPGIGEPVLTATAFNNRLNKASLGIRNNLGTPDIVGVVEVENLTTLQALATQINNDAVAASQPNPNYVAHLVEGNDVGGIDVGFLVKTAIVFGTTPRVAASPVVQELDGTLFVNPDSSTETLNDRPPLRLPAIISDPNGASFPVQVIVVHQRSLNGVNDESAGSNGWPTAGARVRAKRQKQAEDLANLIQTRQTNDPAERIIVLGDFNLFELNDGFVDGMNVVTGTPVPDNETAVAGDGVDLVNPDLDNLVDTPPAGERYSYVFDGQAQNLDHLLVNQALITATAARRIEHPRINTDFSEADRNNASSAQRLSDHDPVVGFFEVTAFGSADVSLTKTLDTAGPYFEGQSVTYTLTVANAGPDAATNIQVTDTPTNLSIVTVSSTNCSSLPCTIPSLGAGSNEVITVTATIPAAGAFDNSANADADEADPNTANNTDNTSNGGTAAASANVSVTKTLDTAGPYFAGQSVTYTITVANAGPSTATNIGVTDTPTNLSITGVSGACTSFSPCTIASLASGANTTITVTATITAAGAFDNSASATATENDPNTGNNTDNTGNGGTAAASADVSLNKTLDTAGPYVIGQSVTYTLTVANAGPSTATSINVTDTPTNLTITGVSGACTSFSPCTIASLGSGANTTITVTATINTAAPFDNSTTATATENDPNSANNTDNTGNGGTAAASADVSLTKTLDTAGPFVIGQSVTYTLTVANAGPSTATSINVTDTPTNLTITGVSGACTSFSPCTIASLASGANTTITVTATINAAAPFDNSATATATENDPNSANNTDNTGNGGSAGPATDVSLTKTLDTAGPYFAGQSVTYTLTVANAGPSTATSINVTDTPTNLTITNVSGACTSFSPCTIASLASGANTTITVTATIAAAGAFDNSATATAAESDPNSANNTDNTGNGGTATSSADVSLTKTLDTAGPYFTGQSVTYTLTVANAGPSAATSINVTDTPTNLTITNVSGACTSFSPCTIASLASGANTTITVTATIAAAGAFDNSATATAESDPNSANNTDNTGNGGTAVAGSYTATKTVSGSFVNGGTISYTIVLTNNLGFTLGDNPGDEFTDVLPSGLALVSANATSGTAAANTGTNTVTWNGSLANGASVTLTITATITATSGTISNQGTANIDTDNNGSNETAVTTDDPSTAGSQPTTFQIVGPSDVTAIKSVSTTGVVGSPVTYSIVITNNMPHTQQANPGDELVDVLPSELALVSASATSGTAVATIGTNTVTWNGSIPSGGSVTITINATIQSTGTVSNQGQVNIDLDNNGTNETTIDTQSPTGGPTVFTAVAAASDIPAVSPLMLLLMAAMLAAMAAWKVTR